MSEQTLKVTRVWEMTLSQADPDPEVPSDLAVMSWMELDDEATEGDDIAEVAGRACYQAWSKPNKATRTNQGYTAHVLDVGHYSLFAHAAVGYMIEGVSRSLTHELVRHRFPTFSQLSQRFVKIDGDLPYVVPPLFRGDEVPEMILREAARNAVISYEALVKLADVIPGVTKKQVREAARCVLPNMTETKIVVSGNLRAWRDMLSLRLPPEADAEIRELAAGLLADLKLYAPNSFQDIEQP